MVYSSYLNVHFASVDQIVIMYEEKAKPEIKMTSKMGISTIKALVLKVR